MKITEIVNIDTRGEYNEEYIHYFEHAQTIGNVPGTDYIFKKAVSGKEIHYGIFDHTEHLLISYLNLDVHPKYVVVSLPSTDPDYQKQGLMIYLYSYAILKDKLTIVSDKYHTPEAKKLWISLSRKGFYIKFYLFNMDNGKKWHWSGDDEPWKNPANIRLMATAYSKKDMKLNEKYEIRIGARAERRRLGMDNPELYGPDSYKIYKYAEDIAD